MANEEVIAVKDAIHKLQLCLLEGIKDENQLFAAGSLLSRRDYQDVVTERTIANMCGYPLCSNCLPSERPKKGHYRISLKEHKVYDLHEAYMYCSTNCVVNSGAFARSLQDERSDTLNTAKLNEVLKLFVGLHLHSTEDVKDNGELGLSKLKIQEKLDVKGGEVSMDEWMGPSDAIEGYFPQRDQSVKPALLNNIKKGFKNKQTKLQNKKNMILNEMDFSSTIITQDGYSISKLPAPINVVSSKKVNEAQTKTSYEVGDADVSILGKQVDVLQLYSGEETEKTDSNDRSYKVDKFNNREVSSGPCQHDVRNKSLEVLNMSDAGREYASDGAREKQSLRSSLKSSNYKKMARSVTWADENIDNGTGKKMECSAEISEEANQAYMGSGPTDMEEDDDSYRFKSAEACAAALKQAAEAVASGSDVPDAVSHAGIIILPPPQEVDEAILQENDEVLDTEPAPLKWPRKPGVPNYDVFESEDSWYDSPPEGFNLNVLLIDTMSFVDPLPAFRMKQWQLIVLLFLDALSICRIPVLTPYMTGRRTLLPKVLDGAHISAAEYEVMKDLVIPLGRVPQFSMQSGG